MRQTDWRKQTKEQWKDDYVPLGGGLNQMASALSVKPGRLILCSNFEERFGIQGYRSIPGYERYSGKASPSMCNYAVVSFSAGTAAIAAGQTITNATTASALVVSVTLSAGSYASGNATGYMIVTSMASSWALSDQIRVGGVQKAVASAASEVGSTGYAGHVAALTAAREALRALITMPVGSGGILGVAVYNNAVYCVRNIASGASATLWKSSSTGWTSVRTGLHAGGAYKFEVANFSGASTSKALFVVSGRTRLFKVDSVGTVTKSAAIYGSEATSTSPITVGTGAKAFAIAETTRNWQVGVDTLTVWDAADSANSMTGLVASYVHPNITINVTSTTGAGALNNWEFGKADYSDKPFLLAEHKDHMMLAYPLGQLQTSNLGDPLTYATTAALFGVGDELTGILSLKGQVLGIYCRTKILLLSGSTSLDWVLAIHHKQVGAVANTVQDNAGNAIFLDDKGLTTMQGTQAFGSFEAAIMSQEVATTLDVARSSLIGTRMAKSSYQYRLYYESGKQLRCTIRTGNPVLQPGDVSFTTQQYAHTPTCFASGTLADGLEHMFFGTSDGYVMEEDAGTSFDGTSVNYTIRLPFNQFKSPNHEKRFYKLIAELASQDDISLSIRQLFNYDNGVYMQGGTQTISVLGAGGSFDVSSLDAFQFDGVAVSQGQTDLDGVGQNMALLIFFDSGYVRPVTLQGLYTFFSILGLKR